jgi:dolichol-phosphate mannosyltransferase
MIVYFLLPAYNEEQNLPELFDEIGKSVDGFRIILVNDGSQDRTGEIAEEYSKRMPMTILTHEKNKGLGAALRTGIDYIVRNSEKGSVVVTMDSDLTHDPAMVKEFLKEIAKGYDVVIASRYEPGGGQMNLPIRRMILSKAINTLLRIKGSKVKDNTSGFRCLTIEIMRKAARKYGNDFIRTSGFTATAEILMKTQKIGAKVKEIPLMLDYGKKRGKSKLKVRKTVTAYIKMLREV